MATFNGVIQLTTLTSTTALKLTKENSSQHRQKYSDSRHRYRRQVTLRKPSIRRSEELSGVQTRQASRNPAKRIRIVCENC